MPATLGEREREVWLFRVERIEHRTKRTWLKGSGDSAEFIERSLGWFVTCGGNVTFATGDSRPALSPGDTLELRRRQD